MTEIESLKAQVAYLDEQRVATATMLANLMNRELALRAAVSALVYNLPKHTLTHDFNMFLDQIVSVIEPQFQKPDEWAKIQSVVEDDRLGEAK